MNIGVDLDGVLFDSESMFRSLSQIYNLKIGGKVIDSEKLRFQDRYNWTWEQCKDFINEYMIDIHKQAPVMPYAKNIIKALESKGHNIYAITSRGLALEGEIDITNNRLEQENINFKQIIYNADNKLEVCKQLNIDIMIDDLVTTIDTIADNGIKCFYYRDNINDKYGRKNVTIVRDWGEIAVELVKMGLIGVDDIKV